MSTVEPMVERGKQELRMKKISSLKGETKLVFDDVVIHLDESCNELCDDKYNNIFSMHKSEAFVDSYIKLREKRTFSSILEFGIHKGGSVVFLDKFFKPDKLVCVDINKEEQKNLKAYIEGRRREIKCFYNTSQDDKVKLQRLISDSFDDGLDLVIDDASHWYAETKSTFEFVFPHVNPGGWYIIEDWSWAHLSGWQEPGSLWHDKPAMTNLIFELLIVHASNCNVISEIIFYPGMACLKRGAADFLQGKFSIDDFLVMRGRSLVGI